MTPTELILIAAVIAFALTADRLLDPLVRWIIARGHRKNHTPGDDTAGLNLYYRPTCPHCVKVLKTMYGLGLDLELKNIARSTANRDALIEGGGKRQVPCLRIDAEGQTPRWLYESADISAWLHREFGNERHARLH